MIIKIENEWLSLFALNIMNYAELAPYGIGTLHIHLKVHKYINYYN